MLYEKYDLDVPYEKLGVTSDGCRAVLTAVVPDSLPNDTRGIGRSAVVICPGGAYSYCSVREAEPVAMRFASFGIASFVLNYSCKKLFPTNLGELAMAVAFVRKNAEKYGVDPERIFICGFSAGGHLAASLGVHWNKAFLYEKLGVSSEMIKPKGQILCYPVITSGEKRHDETILNIIGRDENEELKQLVSLEKQVDSDTLPTFIWCTRDDELVPAENTLLFTMALAQHNIPFASHIFSSGVHGLALCDESTANYDGHINKECSEWVRMAVEWMSK